MGDIRITEEEMRQALNGRHTEGVQSRISAARVAVAGLGGLGSNIAVSLARIGVGRLHLIDFDRVDVTNLNRQQYFADQVGMYKTEALRENLLRINPWLELRTDCLRVTEENAAALLRDDMYICEAFDDAGNKAMLVREVLEKLPGTYLVAASGMAGYGDGNAIHTRRVSSRFYLCGDETTEAAAGRGLMAPRVALCAAHQANMVLRLILGER
ncbi:sulfur carrier protein ThiS adenylyltransferase ThiF [Lachnoclostridium sp. An118]|uniref:sulfur carrier protein ThiS adenylyltransferase ThiF n=1 Tax=Lachnoclostridium sp. An118 TaxID=1965547 RepID=UPI000B37540A|nr:sulfur carrier protein ThiS adenylyltransferase ThiF [Lachnoclostridium sp. An118]OUQ51506.1 thiamine biosynthesis protein ThiF [Lachnoclostridium sp. An118]